jgi:hypothetical protein
MTNWLPTFPLLNRPPSLPDPRDLLAAFDGWSIAELMRNEHFAQAPDESLPRPSSMNARAELGSVSTSPGWFNDTPWRVAPVPQRGPRSRLVTSEDPGERAVIRMQRGVYAAGRRPPSEPPPDYPSHLAPVPRAPDWDAVVTGPTSWSPLAPPPHATDWGQFVEGPECSVSGGRGVCTTQGGRRVSFPSGGLRDGMRFAPGEPYYHSYDTSDGPIAGGPSLMGNVIDRPTRGPSSLVGPATPEGTINEASPPSIYFSTLGIGRGRVRSYLTTDQTGARVVVNVTEPGHPLYPGIVIRYETESPAGSVIRNEGTGRGWLQSPSGPPFVRNRFNNWVWEGQMQELHGSRGPLRPERPLGGR